MVRISSSWAWGLSPRLRGNPRRTHETTTGLGSIPAPAGEPSPVSPTPTTSGVYPRACGGTIEAMTPEQFQTGLSPRLRGNPIRLSDYGPNCRSIPAPAGEPRNDRKVCHRRKVYPRACGGTIGQPYPLAIRTGLSPRLRGNRQAAESTDSYVRSIPAPAGEPTARS